jgi:hypothetical protein
MIFVNAPFPYPYENNLAFVDFVRLQQLAADYVQAEYPHSTIASAWPFPDALRRREFGYVSRPHSVRGLDNFDPDTVLEMKGQADVLVLYSRTWEARWGVIQLDAVRDFLTDYYFYQPQITSEQVQRELGLYPVARWERRGQWIEIYARQRTPNVMTM